MKINNFALCKCPYCDNDLFVKFVNEYSYIFICNQCKSEMLVNFDKDYNVISVNEKEF